jgi:glycosyltransferase involved in cell wall biosynthesis
MRPQVSILIPAYRAAPWLAATLDSALAQTYPHTEIIVVEDGSPDDTLAVARAHATRHPGRLHVVSQPNAGASAARNHALRLARGEFIQFLDADDLLSPRKLELQLATLAAAPAERVATCRWGRFADDPAIARFVDEAVFRDFGPLEWLLLHASQARMMHPAAWLTPRALADRAGPWDERLSLNDDGEYFARVVLASSGLVFSADPAAATYYRSGLASSLSQTRSARACASLELAAELLTRHLRAAEDSPRVRQALADHWQHVASELHPAAPERSRAAEARARALGGSRVPPPLGAQAALLARLIGWRWARRLASRR